jgi:predicted secreted protein
MPATERTIVLKKGEQTEVRLKSSAAGGYDWQVQVDNDKLVAITKTFEAAGSNAPVLPGQSAEEVFGIKALDTGRVVLHFTQQRNWEEGVLPRKEERVIIEISET